MRDAASPLAAMASRTRLSIAVLMLSYSAAWAPSSGTSSSITVFSGRSRATCSLVRRIRKGFTRVDSSRCFARSPRFSIGVRYPAVKDLRFPSRPGISQS